MRFPIKVGIAHGFDDAIQVVTEVFAEYRDQDLWTLNCEDSRYEQWDGEGSEKRIGLGADSERTEYYGIQDQSTDDAQSAKCCADAGIFENIMPFVFYLPKFSKSHSLLQLILLAFQPFLQREYQSCGYYHQQPVF